MIFKQVATDEGIPTYPWNGNFALYPDYHSGIINKCHGRAPPGQLVADVGLERFATPWTRTALWTWLGDSSTSDIGLVIFTMQIISDYSHPFFFVVKYIETHASHLHVTLFFIFIFYFLFIFSFSQIKIKIKASQAAS